MMGLILMIIALVTCISFRFLKVRKHALNYEEIETERAINSWIPKALIDTSTDEDDDEDDEEDEDGYDKVKIVKGKAEKEIVVNGKKCINFVTHNYLGLLGRIEIENAVIEAVNQYGVGACGPRAFYGTVDIHLELEEKIANFLNIEEVVVHSFGFSAISTTISAYAKPGDLIFTDDKVNFAIQNGIKASRATVFTFKHNDASDLQRLLNTDIVQYLMSNPNIRKFLIVEGIAINTGKICPLREYIKLRKEYKMRLFIDESISFGILGKHGKGVTEHYGESLNDVDLMMVSMEHSLATVGGFCAGTKFVTEHQRLSAQGYCFSASLPPLLAKAAFVSLDIIESNENLTEQLWNCCTKVHKALSNSFILRHLVLWGDEVSPIKHLCLRRNVPPSYQQRLLKLIARQCYARNVLITTKPYVYDSRGVCEQFPQLRPSIRLAINVLIDDTQIESLVSALEDAVLIVFRYDL